MHVTRNLARFNHRARSIGNGQSALSDDQIRELAPSVFATEPHMSRSTRFAHIPTFEVLAGLRREGFVPTRVTQNKSRVEGKSDFTKHMIRMRHESHAGSALRLGQTFPEVVLINAHDGTAAYHLMGGLFRLVCLNGMIVMENGGSELHVPHKGDVISRVIEGSFEVINQSTRALTAADAWAGVSLNRDEQMAIAESARVIRFGDAEGNVSTPITADQMLGVRRTDDAGNDLWRTFNRVQENAIRGGLSAWGRNANNQRRRTTSREINGIDQDVKVNRALWMLAERMAELKGAA